LIGLGTAPLDDPMFRAALFEQLGEPRLEGAITTDICGKKDSHAVRLDKEAADSIRKARLHRKVATSIFFESNGGQTRIEATVPEIRLAVAEADLDIGNVETVLESLTEACYYLTVERTRYHFSLKENLNKRFADRRASIQAPKIDERARAEIQKVFSAGSGLERIYFPEQSNQVPDRPVLTLAILAPDVSMQDKNKTLQMVETMTRDCGNSSRTFKSALLWCIADSAGTIHDDARKVLAWEDIEDEAEDLHLDETQRRQLNENMKKAQRDLKESVWRTYKIVVLLGKDNQFRVIDLGLVHSSVADSMVTFILERLRKDGEVEKDISPNLLIRNWNPAFKEWSTKSVRDAFFASPLFPRLLNPDAVKDTIARGVEGGLLGYVGKSPADEYEPFFFGGSLSAQDVEISDEMYIITRETAENYTNLREKPPTLTLLVLSPGATQVQPGKKQAFVIKGLDQHGRDIAAGQIEWKASGGIIDKDGVFTAGEDEGNFVISAIVGAVKGSTAPADDVAISPGKEYRKKWGVLDVKQANALLDKIGLSKKDGEGYRLRTDGKGRVRIELMSVGGQFIPYTQVGEMIKQQWKKIGIDADVKETERGLAFTKTANAEHHVMFWTVGGSENLYLFPRHVLPVDPAECHLGMPFARWYASNGQQGKKPTNPEMLKAFDLLRSAAGKKEAERTKIAQEIWKIIVEECWVIGTVGVSPAFMGVRIVKNNMGNIPTRQTNAQHARTPNTSHPATFFFKA